jgi:hypothetical protein
LFHKQYWGFIEVMGSREEASSAQGQ